MNPIHIAVPVALIAIYVGTAFLWNLRWRPYRINRGHPTDRFGRSSSRLWRFIFTEDTATMLPKVKNSKIKKLTTWNNLYILSLAITLIVFVLSPFLSWIPILFFICPIVARAPKVLKGRQQMLMRMLAVANSTFRYKKGAEMDPWSKINVKKWIGPILPGETVITYDQGWNASPASQDSFETHFSQSVTDENTWIYKWDQIKDSVTMKPVGHIPEKAPYPGSVEREWNEIPLGVGAGGEIVWDTKLFPHSLIVGKTGKGKILHLKTPMFERKKGLVTLADLKEGDEIFDENGSPTKITHLFPIITPEKAYKVILSDGSEIIADPEHLWYTETNSSRASKSMQKTKAKNGWVRKNSMLFSSDEVDHIQSIIDSTNGSETASIPEIASIVNKDASTDFLYRIAKIIGMAEEINPIHKFFYKAQIVKQKQNLLHFNSKEFMEVYNAISVRRTKESPLTTLEIDKLRQLKMEIRDSDKLTTKSIFEYLGIGSSNLARKWIRANYDYKSVNSLIHASESIKGKTLPEQIFSIDKKYINNYDFAAIMGKNSKETHSTFLGFSNKINDKFKKPTEIELIVAEKTVTRKISSYFAYPKKMFLEQILAHAEVPIHDQRYKMSKGSVKTTQEIFETLRVRGRVNHSIENPKALQFSYIDLPIDPYALGAWLGDGSSGTGQICGEDHEVKYTIIKNTGYDVIESLPSREYLSKSFRIWNFPKLTKDLRDNNLLLKPGHFVGKTGSPKHIPTEYLTSSIEQRRELLAGLMDTDGTVDPGGTISFCTIIPKLRDDFITLVRSLGYIPYAQTKQTTKQDNTVGKDAYNINFVAAPEDNIFRIVRKNESLKARFRSNTKDSTSNRRYITDIIEVEPVPMRCLSVDSPSRLFLAGEGLVPTHNSVAQRNIVFHCIQHNDKWCFLGIDPKRVELKPYAKYTNTVLGIATSMEDMTEVIRYAKEEMMNRFEMMEEAGVNHFMDLVNPPRAIMLMVDEAYMLMSPTGNKGDAGKEEDVLHNECSMLVGEIARLGRAAGVHMVLAMQRPDAIVLKGEIKSNLDFRIVAGRMDSTASGMALDNGLATRVPGIIGRGVAQMGGEGEIYQGYFADQDWIDGWLLENPKREPEVVEKLLAKMESKERDANSDIPEDFSDLDDFDMEESNNEIESAGEPEAINATRMDDPSDFMPANAGRKDDSPNNAKESKLEPEDIDPSLYTQDRKSIRESLPELEDNDLISNLMKIIENEEESTTPETAGRKFTETEKPATMVEERSKLQKDESKADFDNKEHSEMPSTPRRTLPNTVKAHTAPTRPIVPTKPSSVPPAPSDEREFGLPPRISLPPRNSLPPRSALPPRQ